LRKDSPDREPECSDTGTTRPQWDYDYVVPHLEELWWFENNSSVQPKDKLKYIWISIIRLPEYVTKEVFHVYNVCMENRKGKIKNNNKNTNKKNIM
jgi:hypothetical protein